MSDYKISVEVKTFADGKVNLLFSCNGGKFGANEMLYECDLTAEELLDILQVNGADKSTEPALHKHIVSNNEVALKCDECGGELYYDYTDNYYICKDCKITH